MRAHEAVVRGPISTNSDVFVLAGGQYMALAVCQNWNGGQALLYILGPDGVTYLSCTTVLSSNGGGIVDLPPGQYQWQLTGVVNGYFSVTRVPVSE